MWRSLRAQLGLVFFAFFMLVAASVAATSWLVKTQHDDATVINLAGRQRMLAQQMTRLALTRPESAELGDVGQRFEQTLHALQVGGTVEDGSGRLVALPATSSPDLLAQLEQAAQTWHTFRRQLESPGDGAAWLVESERLLSQLDQIVGTYEAESQNRTARIQQIQVTFLITAFLLLGLGYALVRRRLLQPLDALGKAAQLMGAGQLSPAVPEVKGEELAQLGRTMEAMRAEISSSRALLEQRVSQRTQELTAAFEFSQEIVHQLQLPSLFQSVARRACALLHGQQATLCLLSEDGQFLELAASSGAQEKPARGRQPAGQGVALPVIQGGQTVAIEEGCTNCGFLHPFAGNHCIAAPLTAGDKTLGALCVVRPQAAFDQEESRALTLLANAAAIAIDNARLLEASRKQAEANAALAERERLSAELHDNLAQTLSFLTLKIEQLAELIALGRTARAREELARIETAVRTAFTQVRAALTGLQQPLPDRDSFAQRVAACVAEFRQPGEPAVELIIHDRSALALSPVAQEQSLHIVREALLNARRHAQAHHITVHVCRQDGFSRFIVEDDGCGFNPALAERPNHLGLKIMLNRAQRSGGQLAVNSAPGAGTQIIASFPLAGEL